jgi:hypothetical protein
MIAAEPTEANYPGQGALDHPTPPTQARQKRSAFRSNAGSFEGSIYVITETAGVVSGPIHPRGLFSA